MCEYREYLFCSCHHHYRGITPCSKIIWLRRGHNLQRVTVRIAQKIAGVRRPSRFGFWHLQAPKAQDIEMAVLPPRAVAGPAVEEVQQAQAQQALQGRKRLVSAGHEVPAAIGAMGFERQAPPARITQIQQGFAGRMVQEAQERRKARQVPAGHEVPAAIRAMGFERQAPPARVMDARQAAEGQETHEADSAFRGCRSEFTETPQRTQTPPGAGILRITRRVNGSGIPPVPSSSDLERAVGAGQMTPGLKGGTPRLPPRPTVEDAPEGPDAIHSVNTSNIPPIPSRSDRERAVRRVEKKRAAMRPSRLHLATVPEESEIEPSRQPAAFRMPPVPSNSDLERHIGPAGNLGGLHPIQTREYVRPSVEDIPEESDDISHVDFLNQPIGASTQHTGSAQGQQRTQVGEQDIGDRNPHRVSGNALSHPLRLAVSEANEVPDPTRPMRFAIDRRIAQLKAIPPVRRYLDRGPSYRRAIQPQSGDTAGAGARELARRAHRNRRIHAYAEGRLAENVAANRPPTRRRDSYVRPEPPVQMWEDKPPAKVMHRTSTDLENHPPGNIEKSYYKFPETDVTYDAENPPGPFCPPPKKLRTENIGDICPDCVAVYAEAKIPHHWANHYVIQYMKTIVYHDIIKLRHVADGSKFGAVMISGYNQKELDAIPQGRMFTGEWDRYWLWIHDKDYEAKKREAEVKSKEEEKEAKKKAKLEAQEKAKKEKEKALKAERERIMQQRQPWRVDMERQRLPTNQEIEREKLDKAKAEKAKAEAAKRNAMAAANYLRIISADDDAAIRNELEERHRKIREARFIEYSRISRGTHDGRDDPSQLRREFEEYERQELERKTRQRKVSEAQTARQAAVFAAADPRAGMSSDFNVQGRFSDPRQGLRGVQVVQPPPRSMPRGANTDDYTQRDQPILQRPQRAFTSVADQINRHASGLGRVPTPPRVNANVSIPQPPFPPIQLARQDTNTDPLRNRGKTVTFSKAQPEIDPIRPNPIRPAPPGNVTSGNRGRTVTFSDQQSEISLIRPNPIRPAPLDNDTFHHYRDEYGKKLVFRKIPYTQFDQPRSHPPRTPVRPALNVQGNANTLQTSQQAYPTPGREDNRESPRTPTVLPHGPQRANTTIDYENRALRPQASDKVVSKKPSKQKLKKDAYGDDYDDQGAFEDSNLYVIGDDSDDSGDEGKWKDGDEGLQLRTLMSRASLRVPKILQHKASEYKKRREESFSEGGDLGLLHGHGDMRALFESHGEEDGNARMSFIPPSQAGYVAQLTENPLAHTPRMVCEEERDARMSYIAPLDLTPFIPPPQVSYAPQLTQNPFADAAVQRTLSPEPAANPLIDAIVQQSMDVIAPQPQRSQSSTFTHALMTAASDLEAARSAIVRPSANNNTSFDDSYEEEFARRMAMLAPRSTMVASPEPIRRSTTPEAEMLDPSYFENLDDDLDVYGAGPSRLCNPISDEYDLDLDVYGAGPPRRPSPMTAPMTPAPRPSRSMEWGRGLWGGEGCEDGEEEGSPKEGRTENGGRWASV